MASPRKPRYDSTQRVLAKMRREGIIRDIAIRNHAIEHGICPDHLHYLPCSKCQ